MSPQTRRDVDPADVGPWPFYRLLTSVVVPRPIAWVSTRSADGHDNLAPHSFYSVSCVDPPIAQFTSVGRKNTLNNVEQTREFVINFCPASMFEQINATATDFPPDVSEPEAVGIELEPSERVAAKRVRASPAALECELHETLELGNSTVVMGRVVHASVAETVYEGDLPSVKRLDPIARLGASEWSELGRVRSIERIGWDEWPGHYDAPGDSPTAY
ncbi:MAG: flavin reductase family protein [Solirubrobacterales bacterium]